MGDRVESGPLIYSVLEAEWRTQLEAGGQPQLPTHRFLLVHITVTNSGAETMSMPAMTIVDDGGQSYSEAATGADIPAPLGVARNLKPAETLDGRVLFDVEPKSYKLKLEDVSGSGKSALVDMPLQFSSQPAIPGATP